MAVGLGIVSSIGITMLVGLYFTTMHGIMPFLCLGNKLGSLPFTSCLYLEVHPVAFPIIGAFLRKGCSFRQFSASLVPK